MSNQITTSYVSRICDVPPLVASAGLAQLARTTPSMSGSGWELRIERVTDEHVSGVLTAGWVQRAAVSLEIEPWSRARVIIGLRHRARAVPWWTGIYFTSAHEAVAHITTAIESWADEPLRAVLEGELGLARQ
jgi:hypothetical protein